MSTELASLGSAFAHVRASMCRLGPPELIGAELEWVTAVHGARPSITQFGSALGPHSPDAAQLPLGAGARVTIEPGGQIELASAVHRSARALCDALSADHVELAAALAQGGIEMLDGAMDLDRAPQRILEQPRYRAMEERFAKIGPLGTVMMCNTAAVQISVDCGADDAEAELRWAVLHEAGPALAAAFADSPALPAGLAPLDVGGLLPERSTAMGEKPGWEASGRETSEQWASQRLRAWLELDPARTGFAADWLSLDDYARWVVDAPLLCARRAGADWTAPDVSFAGWMAGAAPGLPAPGFADLDYHLTTMFPPVRACGHFEVRYLDAQPSALWRVPIAAIDALLRSPDIIAQAREIAGPTIGRWRASAQCGLADGDLREAATQLMELAAEHAGDADFAADLDAAALRCKRGLRPSEVTP